MTPLKILLIVFSFITFGCSNKQTRPKPEVCVYKHNTKTFHCYDPKIQKGSKKNGLKANKFICMSPEDFNTSLHFLHGIYKEDKK